VIEWFDPVGVVLTSKSDIYKHVIPSG
jgi:hypothetical protein